MIKIKSVRQAIFLLAISIWAATGPAIASDTATRAISFDTGGWDTMPHALLPARPPVYAPRRVNVASLQNTVQDVMALSVQQLIDQVPVGTGIFFIGCPNCHGGAEEKDVLEWHFGMGDEVQCKYCHRVFPNKDFPNNRSKEIRSPDGKIIRYDYYEDSAGKDYYFNAHAWYERWEWIRNRAKDLALLWYATKDNAYGDRAAAIIGQFAHVFPDYPVRYDYPNANVRFFPANQKWPYEGLNDYRGAKWRRWAYDDIPNILVEVYDLLQSGYDWSRMKPYLGDFLSQRIVSDLFKMAYEFTTANPEKYSNKSPGLYNQMIRLGRVIGEPAYVHEGVKRFREFCEHRFYRDGWWVEGSTAYHAMVVRSLTAILKSAKGYTDPAPGSIPDAMTDLDLSKKVPVVRLAVNVTKDAILPDKRRIPINDTWWYNTEDAEFDGRSKLWDGVGDALLTNGGPQPSALNINWSGNYGHDHFDNGSIILYAFGKELFSDIGYTHTKYRGWSRHTASHNTVLIDEKGQDEHGKALAGTGRLLHYDVSHPKVKTIWVDASPAYKIAKKYQRRLVYVQASPGLDYVVDLFEVEGGKRHDYFLHGSSDELGDLHVEGNGKRVSTLKPDWGGARMPQEQHDLDPEGKTYHPYIHFSDIRSFTFKDQIRFYFQYHDTGVQVFHFLPGKHELFSFLSPSIRQAQENEPDLDKFSRHGVMIRSDQAQTRFLSVYAPYKDAQWLQNVVVKDSLVTITYLVDGKSYCDSVVLGKERVQVIPASGKKYDSGQPFTTNVTKMGLENKNYVLYTSSHVDPSCAWVRLIFPDGSSQYQRVLKITGSQVILRDDPGLTLANDGSIIFRTFPQRRLKGSIRLIYFK